MDKIKNRNIKQFDGENYNVWKVRVLSLLKELKVNKVIEANTISEPVPEDWIDAENTAKNVLLEYLSDTFVSIYVHFSAKQILNDLDKTYARKSLSTQIATRKQLLKLKLTGDTTLKQHFQKFTELISELINAGGDMDEMNKIALLLTTLPSTYDGVTTAIETMSEENLTLCFVKTRLLDHEIKIRSECDDTSTKVLQVQTSNSLTTNNNRNQNYQQKYNKSFKQFNRPLKYSNNKLIKCNYCGKNGHIKRNCYKLSSRNNKINNNYNKKRNNNINQPPQTIQTIQRKSDATKENAFIFMISTQNYERIDSTSFFLDSGASDHCTNNSDILFNCEDLRPPIKISTAKKDAFIEATKKGSIRVVSNMGIKGVINNVLFCKDLPNNLLSVGKLQQAGMEITFNENGAEIKRDGVKIAYGNYVNNMYVIKFNINNVQSSVYSISSENSLHLWHERLGHIGKSQLYEIINKKLAKDVDLISNLVSENKLCESCIYAKQTRLPFNSAKDKEYIKRPLFIVHSDVCGPISPPGIGNKNYFVIFIDQYTHYTTVYLLTYKSEVFSVFKDYAKKSEAHFNYKIVHLYCDNGGEYLSNDMKKYCVNEGISYHLTIPRTPQLNGVSERLIRTITEKARAMINGAKLNKVFWGEAVVTATYLINNSPTRALKFDKSPFEMWHNKKPELRFLRIFGSTVYVHDKVAKSKFDKKSWKGILTGYAPNGYRIWDPVNENFVVARDVVIDEVNFLTSRPHLNCNVDLESSHDIKRSRLNDDQENSVLHEKENVETNEICHNKEGEVRRSERIKLMSDKEKLLNVAYALNVLYEPPQNFSEIESRSDSEIWLKAVREEINSLVENDTWEIVVAPEEKVNIVDCRWVFTVKHDEFGKPLRCKARLVAKGFSQEYLTDYEETFAPVARMTSFRIMCAFANQYNLLIHQMDVKTAFLNGILKEVIYMKIPEGVNGGPNEVCKLKKALYGLKQAARCWFEMFEQVLIGKGFHTSSADRCVYLLDNGSILKNIYVVLYVDDIVIATADINRMQNFKAFLMNKFKMTDMHEIKFFLGIQIERNEGKIFFNQSAYIKKILTKFNMLECNPISTPLPSKINFQVLNQDKNENEKYPCRNLIGCLMYIMLCTRPDLSAAVSIMSRYSNKENRELWLSLKRILRYLKGTINLKLTYERKKYENFICGYVDSDWGSDDVDRKSTSGYLFKMFDNCSISWVTRKQTSVAASSTEAEYMALFEATREAKWLKMFIDTVCELIKEPILIFEDNNGCICIANNPTSHKRSKHIDIKYHFIKEQVEKKIIKLNYIPTENQIADAMTKPLTMVKFEMHREEMGLL